MKKIATAIASIVSVVWVLSAGGVIGCSKSTQGGGGNDENHAPPSALPPGDLPPPNTPSNLDTVPVLNNAPAAVMPTPYPDDPDDVGGVRAKLCTPANTASVMPALSDTRAPVVATLKYNDLQSTLVNSCAGCHGAPAANIGGFSFATSYNGQELPYNGTVKTYPGIKDSAERIHDAIASGRMPPKPLRDADPKGFERLGKRLESWIANGKPNGEYPAPADEQTQGVGGGQSISTDLGDCIPKPEVVGHDLGKDFWFNEIDSLPESLEQTDLFTLDSLELAKKGTLSYNVEYPLWADNAEKGRYIHVPSQVRLDDTKAFKSLKYDATNKKFNVPENTRFYKTFYKEVKRSDGKIVFRKIETRIIVVRYGARKPLYGTYVWDVAETRAVLNTEKYRDGTPFKDLTFDYVVDEATGKKRKYALPGAQRCVDCHRGTDNFVLGFTPLEINRRAFGEGGRDLPVGPDELSQVSRLLKIGIVSGFKSAAELPVLEKMGNQKPRNDHELRIQGYMVGNCAHCHNPAGLAMKDNDVPLDMSPGEIFQFSTSKQSKPPLRKYYVRPRDDLMQSHLYYRVKARDNTGLNPVISMPMHTPGGSSCRLVNLMGKWIKSIPDIDGGVAGVGNVAAGDAYSEDCATLDDFDWNNQDFTWPRSDKYVPRRADWNDPVNGMPEKFRSLRLDPFLKELLNKPIPVGWWDAKDTCKFPDQPPLEGDWQAPWMFKQDAPGVPKFPLGQVYAVKPGAWFYTTTCQKCHGGKGDGNSAIANGLLQLSNGEIRVANFVDGMFGNTGKNLHEFNTVGVQDMVRNLGGNYLIWMAMEGTRVNFPPAAAPYVGKHKAQMLNGIRDKCLQFIPTAQQAYKTIYGDYAVFKNVCFFNNGNPADPELQFDPSTGIPVNRVAQDAWADRAAINAGWAVYEYLKNDATRSGFAPSPTECEKVYPVAGYVAPPAP